LRFKQHFFVGLVSTSMVIPWLRCLSMTGTWHIDFTM
jgi:hypothetical protein